jgi:4'-phosphopantetheinyl transferase EntD
LAQVFHFKENNHELLLWQINEPLVFFTSALTGWRSHLHRFKNDEKKVQYAAARFCAAQLLKVNGVESIRNDEFRRPFIAGSKQQISISHDKNYAAVIVGLNRVGVDVFYYSDKVLKIAHKFLSPNEYLLLDSLSLDPYEKLKFYSMAWCIKETVFKWMQMNNIEFKTDMVIKQLNDNEAIVNTIYFGNIAVSLKFEMDYCLSWIGGIVE